MKFANKKAQSAMEYLMTYGWAILIVIIVAAALYALGVFNPATFTGRTATGFQTIGAPTDWNLAGSGALTLNLQNAKMATALTIYNMTATISGNSTTSSNFNMVLGPGASNSTSFTIYPTQTAGSTYSVRVSVVYSAGGLLHTDTGTVTGVVG
jgi:uncharacterized protein (UPF0333 family)